MISRPFMLMLDVLFSSRNNGLSTMSVSSGLTGSKHIALGSQIRLTETKKLKSKIRKHKQIKQRTQR